MTQPSLEEMAADIEALKAEVAALKAANIVDPVAFAEKVDTLIRKQWGLKTSTLRQALLKDAAPGMSYAAAKEKGLI